MPSARFHLDPNDVPSLTEYLRESGWLRTDEQVMSVESPGDGNMNCTLRVRTATRSCVLKQSRDYVEKYPQIPAPIDRVLSEAEFYRLVQPNPFLAAATPQILHVDEVSYCILEEDLGEAADYTWMYARDRRMEAGELGMAVRFLAELHRSVTVDTTQTRIRNRDLRALNAEHIFDYPLLENNGLNLDDVLPGLQSVAVRFRRDAQLKSCAAELRQVYLGDGPVLLHGDYYPGSWLKTAAGFRVIDPEFCFFGPPEFDLAVMRAHLLMSQQPPEHLRILDQYPRGDAYDARLELRLCGMEILRRIIGLAQLPLSLSLDERVGLLERARTMIIDCATP